MEIFRTIRAVSSDGVLPENRLRAMLREGRLPGIYSGSRFYVHVPQLLAQLERDSQRCGGAEDSRGQPI